MPLGPAVRQTVTQLACPHLAQMLHGIARCSPSQGWASWWLWATWVSRKAPGRVALSQTNRPPLSAVASDLPLHLWRVSYR